MVKTVTNEEVTPGELGGAVHATTKSGVADWRFENDIEALQCAALIDFLPLRTARRRRSADRRRWDRMEPSLDTLIPPTRTSPTTCSELIEKVVDEGDFFESQPRMRRTSSSASAASRARTVGFVANQPMVLAGVLDIDSSRKAARFVRFCDCFKIPIVTFVDVPGFLPGTAQEYGGIIKHGAKLLFAYAEATVPKSPSSRARPMAAPMT